MNKTTRSSLVGLAFAVVALSATAEHVEAQRRDRDVITREELVQSSQKSADLYQAVRSLRSHFLQTPRGPRSLGINPPRAGQESGSARPTEVSKAVLYVNGARTGDIELLRNYLTINVEEVRYLTPNAASIQYGQGHEGGAVLVKLVEAGRPDR